MARIFACLLTLLFSLSGPAMEENAVFWRSSLAAETPTVQIFSEQKTLGPDLNF